jgi:hypothetical protein
LSRFLDAVLRAEQTRLRSATGPAAPPPTGWTARRLPRAFQVIAVASNKGGVGKTTVATNLAEAEKVFALLARWGEPGRLESIAHGAPDSIVYRQLLALTGEVLIALGRPRGGEAPRAEAAARQPLKRRILERVATEPPRAPAV